MKKSGLEAIGEWVPKLQFSGLPKTKSQLVFFAQYLLTYDPNWYPADWPKRPELLGLVVDLTFIERVAYSGALMAMEWERVRDQGGFVLPKKGI